MSLMAHTQDTLSPRVETKAYRAKQVSFSYSRPGARAGDKASWVLRGLTFEIAPGEVLGVLGPNGSGKSSLLKLLAKVLRHQEGAIHLFGRSIDSFSQTEVARTVALVPQQSQLLFPFTIVETVLMGRFPHQQVRGGFTGFGWETPGDIRLAEQAMEAMEILPLAGRPTSEVSDGERQRAIIARALAQTPRVLLLDEPTVFLDLRHQLDICTILRRLNAEDGLTVVLVSHDLNLAAQYSDRLLLLKDGEIFRIGTPDEVIRQEVLEAVYHCKVLVDRHPVSGLPRVTLPGRLKERELMADS